MFPFTEALLHLQSNIWFLILTSSFWELDLKCNQGIMLTFKFYLELMISPDFVIISALNQCAASHCFNKECISRSLNHVAPGNLILDYLL